MPYLAPTEELRREWAPRTQPPWFPLVDRGSEILLRQVSPNTWQLVEGFVYEVPEWARKHDEPTEYAIPPHDLRAGPEDGNSTDLASVPAWLWWFVASHGKHTRAALLHDHLIDLDDVPDGRADRLFRVALEESNVHFLRRWLMWCAVSLASLARRRWGRPFVALFALHLAAAVGSAVWWAGSVGWPRGLGPWWSGDPSSWTLDREPWLLALALMLLGFLWGTRRWPASVVGLSLIALPSLLIGAAYVVNFAVDLVFHGPDAELGHPYRGESGPF